MIKEKIRELILARKRELELNGIEAGIVLVEKTINSRFGDYSTNVAFMLSKVLDKSPQEVAENFVAALRENLPPEIAKVEAVGGYINFFLSNDYLRKQLAEIYKNREKYGRNDVGGRKKIIIEYSQPNIAKPMHIGHLRNTVLGDALANILEFLGYKVIRWNYIGDWGTQFGKLIAAYKLWSSEEELKIDPVKVMVDLYVRFNQEAKTHPELERRGQEEFRKLEMGDKENLRLWKWFREESLKEFKRTYKILGVEFNETIGESFFEKGLGKLVDWLMKEKIAEVGEEGAIIINLARAALAKGVPWQGLPSQPMPPALIRKGDGASLYLTRDIAALKYRLEKYKPAKILYIVGNEQSLHFEQLFAVAKILGWGSAELRHVKYGLVLGENRRKMSTREGEAVPLAELVKKAVELALKIVEDKNPDLSELEKQKIAETVGLGALKYEMLKEHRNSDIIFDWKKMLDLRGNSAPYLQYTYARLASILRKTHDVLKLNLKTLRFTPNELKDPSELAIIKHLIDFPDMVAATDSAYTTNHLALYLYQLANLANQFYETVRVLDDDNKNRLAARLVLIETACSILKTGLSLLGIKALDKI